MEESFVQIYYESLLSNVFLQDWYFHVDLRRYVGQGERHARFQNFQWDCQMFKCSLIDACNSLHNFRKIVGLDFLRPYDSLLALYGIDKFFLAFEVDGAFLKFLEYGVINPFSAAGGGLFEAI